MKVMERRNLVSENRMMGLPYGEEVMIAGRNMWTQSTRCARQTDRRMERFAMTKSTLCKVSRDKKCSFLFLERTERCWSGGRPLVCPQNVVIDFYRPKPSGARYCQGKLSVRPSVRLSVCNVEVSWSGWNSAKILSQQLITVTFSLSADPHMTDLFQREHPKF